MLHAKQVDRWCAVDVQHLMHAAIRMLLRWQHSRGWSSIGWGLLLLLLLGADSTDPEA